MTAGFFFNLLKVWTLKRMSFKILVEINSKRSNEMSKIYEVMKKYGRMMA